MDFFQGNIAYQGVYQGDNADCRDTKVESKRSWTSYNLGWNTIRTWVRLPARQIV